MFRDTAKTLTVGFFREDGDFEVVATFNNSGQHLSNEHFVRFVNEWIDSFDGHSSCHALEVFVREDAPDVIFQEDILCADLFEEV
jgi:hypothetical protein